MSHRTKILLAVAGGLAFALVLRGILSGNSEQRDIAQTLSNLKRIHAAVSMYVEDHGSYSNYASAQPAYNDLVPATVPREAFFSPRSISPRGSVTYWTSLPTNDLGVILASDLSFSQGAYWLDQLSKKRGLGITREGQLLDISAYGDPTDPKWWTDSDSRL